MSLKVNIKKRIKFPKIDLTRELRYVADRIIVSQLATLIDNRVNIDGKNHPQLEQSTIEHKRKKRKKGSLSAEHQLVDTGLLRTSFKSFKKYRNFIIVRIKAGRRKVANYLQVDGVGRNKKKFKFFGVTNDMEQDAIKYMNTVINRLVRRTNAR